MDSAPLDPRGHNPRFAHPNKPIETIPLLFVMRDVEEEVEFNTENADKLYNEGRYMKALEIFKEVHSKTATDKENIVKKMGHCLIHIRDYEAARELLYNVLRAKENTKPRDELAIAQIIGLIGQGYLGDAKYIEASEKFQTSLDMILALDSANYYELANCYLNFAELFEDQGKYQDSLGYIEKAESVMTNFRDEHMQARLLYLTGKIYLALTDYSRALQYTRESLRLRENIYGSQGHPDTAICYNAFGNIYLVQGKCMEALKNYQKALEIRKIYLGDFHPSVAGTYNNIAIVETRLGNYNQALDNYKKCLQTEIDYFGESHPEVGSTYNNIANVFNKKRQYEDALKYYDKALNIRIQVYGESHSDVATTYNNMGMVYRDQGELDTAEVYFERSIQIRRSNLMNKHPDTANSYINLGLINCTKKNFPKALESFIRALKVRLHLFGKDHTDVAQCYYNIAILFQDMRNLGTFEGCIQKCQMIYKRGLGRNHTLTRTANSLNEDVEKEKAQLYNNEMQLV